MADSLRPRPFPSAKLSHLFALLVAASMGFFALFGSLPTASAGTLPSLTTLSGSAAPQVPGARLLGHHTSTSPITVGLVLAVRDRAGLERFISELYTPGSKLYHHWLGSGQFDVNFGPSQEQTAAVQQFLRGAGLRLVAGSPSSTLMLASGTVSQIEAAFHTRIDDYQLSNGKRYFANVTNLQLPSSLSGKVIGVLGLTNVDQARTHDRVPDSASASVPPPYGAGPYGRGLTPSQITGIYNADPVYSKLKVRGQGITTAVFELSGYTRSDVTKYKQQFGLPNMPVDDVFVLGGTSDHSGAAEVTLDIDLQIAIAPGVKRVLVYQAPNTEIGDVAEYLQIARDNRADAISTSWGECEYLTTSSLRLGEYQAFAQMATQGQSIFDASGDSGAFDCLPYTDKGLQGNNVLQVDDPGSQPYMTAVGGTSFARPDRSVVFNPGKNPHPRYPGTNAERVWLRTPCNAKNCDGGASGGGVSRFWGAPDYQYFGGQSEPGVVEPGYSQSGAYCGQTAGVLCREVPDVSLDADPTTGYAIYCTDPADSFCTNPARVVNHWNRIGGTSCSAPIWAGIAALLDSHVRGRTGLLNYYLYSFDSKAGYSSQFHDITIGDNGHYPARATYDLSTGVGTPDIYRLVKP